MSGRVLAICALASLLVGAALTFTASHYERRLADERAARATDQAAHADTLRALAVASSAELAQRAAEADALARELYEQDARHYEEKQRDAKMLEDMQLDVGTGARRLFVHADCTRTTAGGAGLPSATPATGLGDGTAVEVAARSRRAYFRLRAGMTNDQAKLRALQDYVRTIQKGSHAQAE